MDGKVRALCDYIFTSSPNEWTAYRRTRPRGICTDHIMVTARVQAASKADHTRYRKRRAKAPFRKPTPETVTEKIYEEVVKDGTEEKEARQHRPHTEWIDEKTWELIDERAEVWENR